MLQKPTLLSNRLKSYGRFGWYVVVIHFRDPANSTGLHAFLFTDFVGPLYCIPATDKRRCFPAEFGDLTTLDVGVHKLTCTHK